MLISFNVIFHSITQAKLLNKWKADIKRTLEHISFRKTSLVTTLLYHISSKRCGFEKLMADYDHRATLFERLNTLSLKKGDLKRKVTPGQTLHSFGTFRATWLPA